MANYSVADELRAHQSLMKKSLRYRPDFLSTLEKSSFLIKLLNLRYIVMGGHLPNASYYLKSGLSVYAHGRGSFQDFLGDVCQ